MAETQTLADVIFGSNGRLSRRQMKKLHKASSSRAVRKEVKAAAPGVRGTAVWGQVRTRFPDLFQVPATNILQYGWDKFCQVGKALYPDNVQAGDRVQIPLHDKIYKSEHFPRIELYFQGKRISSLQFQCIIILHFESIMLIFQNGDLIELRPGGCKVTAEIRFKKILVFQRPLTSINWPGSITRKTESQNINRSFSDHQTALDSSGTTNPALPPVRKKRGCGCFLMIFIFLSAAACAGLWVVQNWSQLQRSLGWWPERFWG